jgi:hypothetical protein
LSTNVVVDEGIGGAKERLLPKRDWVRSGGSYRAGHTVGVLEYVSTEPVQASCAMLQSNDMVIVTPEAVAEL